MSRGLGDVYKRQVHIPQVGLIHSDQQVELVIVGVGELPGRLARAVDAVLRQLPPGRRIDRVPDLLRAGGGGLDVELGLQSRLLHQILHHELSHGAAADIAVAHKQDSCHRIHAPSFFLSIAQMPLQVEKQVSNLWAVLH